MTEAEARSRLAFLAAADQEPELGEAELDDVLLMARVADRYDRPPYLNVTPNTPPVTVNPDYEVTWDLNLAAAEAWRRKAGKVALDYDMTAAGKTLQRSQRLEACLRMATMYAGRCGIQTIELRSPLTTRWGLPVP